MGHRLFAVEGHSLLGRYVRKVFNIGPFNGKVVGWRYTKGEYQFRVVFSDNDVEDITEEEVLEGIELFGSSTQTESSDKELIDEAEKKWKEKRKQVSLSYISLSFANAARESQVDVNWRYDGCVKPFSACRMHRSSLVPYPVARSRILGHSFCRSLERTQPALFPSALNRNRPAVSSRYRKLSVRMQWAAVLS
jgi:hypothetical protein